MTAARHPEQPNAAPERRRTPRIDLPFPARVSGADAHGTPFEAVTTLDNIGAGGLLLRVPHTVAAGSMLLVAVRFNLARPEEDDPAVLAAQGRVLRAERLPDGSCAVALAFTGHRFLDAADPAPAPRPAAADRS